ncbi:MAG: hypothetical protein WA642_00760 [Steroidobacteraceae bacterium]
MGLFDKQKAKVRARAIGRIPSSHFNQLTIHSESRADVVFENVRWDAISVIASNLVGCTFKDVHAESVNLGEGLTQSTYTDCIFEGCNFAFGAIGNVRLARCSFNRCRLFNFIGTKLEMIDCTFPETRIQKAVFHRIFHSAVPGHIARDSNEFSGNDFSAANLIDVDFRGGIELEKQVLPGGSEYIFVADTHLASELAHELIAEVVQGSPDAKRLQSIRRMLERDHSTGQKQQLLRLTGCDSLTDTFRKKLNESF